MTTSFPAVAVHLVDDEAPVRDALEFLFVSHELPVRSYASGQLFLDSLQQASHELSGCIVLDVRMEPISGLQVHDALTARGIRVPVIFLTGHGDIPMAVEALKKGAFDFVEKPAGDAALVQHAIGADVLDGHSQIRRMQQEHGQHAHPSQHRAAGRLQAEVAAAQAGHHVGGGDLEFVPVIRADEDFELRCAIRRNCGSTGAGHAAGTSAAASPTTCLTTAKTTTIAIRIIATLVEISI